MEKQCIALVLSILGCYAITVQAECNATNEISATIDSGLVCGLRRAGDNNGTYASFRGIEYGDQPVGPYRFKELRKKTPWEGYFNASVEGAICPQIDVFYGKLVYPNRTMSEECIHLNVHVPLVNYTADLSCQSGLPIIVFIHGGGFSTGSGDADIEGPEYLVSKGVILITINYRLNVFGFLSLDSEEIPGNAGLRDGLMALKWVQTNAAAFGGDPNNVTLIGQSAGAALVHLLSLSNATEGLFSRVVMMSGTGNPGFFSATKNFAKTLADLYLSEIGINSTNTTYIHEMLTEMSLDKIMAAYAVFQDATGAIGFTPVIESSFENVTMIVAADPKKLVEQGQGNQYPLIIGITSKETVAFENRFIALNTVERIPNNTQLVLSPTKIYEVSTNKSLELAAEVLARYFTEPPTLAEYLECTTDTYFKYPTFDLARMRAASGGADVFMYYYTYHSNKRILVEALNITEYEEAIHLEDMLYIFKNTVWQKDHNSFPPATEDDYMTDWMTDFFVNFTRCNDPTCSGGTLWQPVTTTSLNYQWINKPYEYNNTLPTEDQLSMIAFFDGLEAEAKNDTTATT